ncbi:MAG: hypothetical protein HKN20_16720 [Gemmatimonadetes bacterium]|nr:hypothetical protein [Gemmatimonadota bacterium]
MNDRSPKDRFLDSLERCAESEEFIPTFYSRFIGASDAVAVKFENTDFKRQNKMLIRSLRLAAGATSGDPNALRELTERAETHDRHHLDIEPRLYDYWLSALIETASEFDGQWNEPIEQAWLSTLSHVIDHMKRHY